ncbi:MAG TPA: hypothetical protein VMH27_09720 [Puia sp.]|nr:hypothetical protein [Puia sp.]
MSSLLCQTGFRVALCSILFTILVFAVNPILTRLKVVNKTVKVLIGIIVFIVGCWVISILPKGNCSVDVAFAPGYNSTTQHNDSSVVPPKIIVIHDTPEAFKHRPTRSARSRQQADNSLKPPVTNSQNNDSGGSGIQNNAANYAPQAGRDQYNLGIIPRKISEAEVMQLMNYAFPNKNIQISFVCYNGGADAEVNSVKAQITSILKKNGYYNIEENFHVTVGFTPPEKISFDSVRNENMLQIAIPPAK